MTVTLAMIGGIFLLAVAEKLRERRTPYWRAEP